MGIHRRAGAALAISVFVIGALCGLVPATPASAATSLTVTPSTGLTTGQTVTIAGAGWVPGHQVGVCQALAIAPVGPADCAGGFPVPTVADEGGNISLSITVDRLPNVPAAGGQVDCADPATHCVVGAADVNDVPGTVVTVGIAFAPPPPPTVVAHANAGAEGNSGTTNLFLPITVTNPNLQSITVPWKTVFVPGAPGNQADPATDYTPTSGTVTFPSGEGQQQEANIGIKGDTLIEPDEYIVVQLTKPANANLDGAGTGLVTITNDDRATVLPGGATATEGNSGLTNVQLPVTLSTPSPQTITVQWNTAFVTGASDIQAVPGVDYTAVSGTVTFAPGETTKTVIIPLHGDTVVEPDELFVVSFHNVTGPARMGGFWGLGFIFILNDDS